MPTKVTTGSTKLTRVGGTKASLSKASLSMATTAATSTMAVSTAKADKATESVLTETTGTTGSSTTGGGIVTTGDAVPTETIADTPTGSKLPAWAMALIAAGVIGLGIAVYYFFIRKK